MSMDIPQLFHMNFWHMVLSKEGKQDAYVMC